MSEDSESHFTITFGRAGRVVKRSGGGSDDGIAGAGAVAGSKRSVKDRLGTKTVDDSLEDRSHGSFKRQRIENNQGYHRRNSSNDTSLGNGDLRFKLMQKNVSSQSQDNDPPTDVDLRDKLSSKSTLPPAHRRRSYSPKATLGKRKSMSESRDAYDGRGHYMADHRTYEGERQSMREPRGAYRVERQSMREPRGAYSVEKRSMRDRRGSYSVERQRMREPRGNYSIERPSIREPRVTYSAERRSMREPRDSYNIERRSMREPRDSYNIDRRSMRESRDIYNVENRSVRETRDDYNVERRSIRGPRSRDTYNVERRNLQDPRDSYNAGQQSMREPRERNSIEKRSIREPRAIYSDEEQSLREARDDYSVGRRSIREPRDTSNVDRQSIRERGDSYSGERRSMREPRDACNGGKASMLESRDDYDHRKIRNVGPGSRMGSESPAVSLGRTPYTLDNLRRRSPFRVVSSSISPERNVEELQRSAPIRTYDDVTSNAYRRNNVPSPYRTVRSATLIQQPALNAAPRLLANPAPVAAQFHPLSGVIPRIPSHGQQPTIDRFLQSMSLEEYSNHFKKEEVDFYALSQMSDPEIKELGIPMGPRKRILHALSVFRRQ